MINSSSAYLCRNRLNFLVFLQVCKFLDMAMRTYWWMLSSSRELSSGVFTKFLITLWIFYDLFPRHNLVNLLGFSVVVPRISFVNRGVTMIVTMDNRTRAATMFSSKIPY